MYIAAMQSTLAILMAALCIVIQHSYELRSRGNTDTMMLGWPKAEMPELSSYWWYL